MIDWLAAARGLAVLHEHPERTQKALTETLSSARCFQNADYPLSPMPLYARHSEAAAMVGDLQAYVALLGRIVGLYRQHPGIRRWYGLGPAAEALIAADARLGDTVAVCRLDGYLEQATERLFLLENNADAPAGTLFSARINNVVQDVAYQAGLPPPGPSPLTLSSEMMLLDVLVDLLGRAGLPAGNPRVAILQFDGASNMESQEMVRALRAAGLFALVADPRSLQVKDGRAWFGGHPVDVCWNKVNTVAWRSAIEPDHDLVTRWVTAVKDASFVNVNSFGARYVAESKFSLALPRQPAFAGLFSPQEHALVDRLLPWARRLSGDAVAADGESSLAEEVTRHPGNYVIKEPYDIRGDGVTIGRAVGQEAWDAAVKRALARELVVQRYVPPAAYPVFRAGQEPSVIAMPVSFDTFVTGGQVRGFGSKASLNARLNVFQGGQKLAVHVCGEK